MCPHRGSNPAVCTQDLLLPHIKWSLKAVDDIQTEYTAKKGKDDGKRKRLQLSDRRKSAAPSKATTVPRFQEDSLPGLSALGQARPSALKGEGKVAVIACPPPEQGGMG